MLMNRYMPQGSGLKYGMSPSSGLVEDSAARSSTDLLSWKAVGKHETYAAAATVSLYHRQILEQRRISSLYDINPSTDTHI